MSKYFRCLGAVLTLAIVLPACSESNHSRHDLAGNESFYQEPPPRPAPSINSQQPTSYTPWQQAKRWNTDAVEPPAEYYSALIKALQNRAKRSSLGLVEEAQEDEAPVLYVDFDGEDLTYGFDDSESFILCEDEASIPPAELIPAEQQEVLSEVQRYFDDANVLLHVTDVRPESGEYTTIYVTGAIDDLGCEEDDSVLGIAPLDRGQNNPNDIGFAFTRNLNPEEDDLVYMTAVVVAHEAGHTYGLRHNDNDDAIMYPSVQLDVIGFAVGYARKLIFKTRQDSPKILRNVLDVRDPDLLPEDESEAGFKGTWCERIMNAQEFLLINFSGFDLESDWLQPPSYCEESI